MGLVSAHSLPQRLEQRKAMGRKQAEVKQVLQLQEHPVTCPLSDLLQREKQRQSNTRRARYQHASSPQHTSKFTIPVQLLRHDLLESLIKTKLVPSHLARK